MSQKTNPTAVGAFVLGALLLVILAVLLFGSGRLTRSTERYVIYFEGSVVGLDPGAAVVFRGVPVGTVSEIKAFYDAQQSEIHIPVYIELTPGRVDTRGEAPTELDPMQRLIENGMRAQLALQSLVTGKLYVSLDMHPEQPAVYRGQGEVVGEIPSIPTTFERLQATVAKILNRLREMPLEQIFADLGSTIAHLEALLGDPALAAAVSELDDTVIGFRDLAQKTSAQVDPVGSSVRQAADETSRALAQLQLAIEQIQRDLGSGSPVQYEAIRALQEVGEAARSLRDLTQTLSDQPDSLIFGRRVGEQP
jgi:paraquat-inducible protein B